MSKGPALKDWLPEPKVEDGPDRVNPGSTAVPESVDGLAIYNAPFEDRPSVIDNLLFPGATLFAGRPKIGKSWLTLQIACAVATGQSLWSNFKVRLASRVVYCALEEPRARTAARLKKLFADEDALLSNLKFIYQLKPLMGGGIQELDAFLSRYPAALVVIDTLAAVVRASSKRDVLRSDYEEVNVIRQLAEKHNAAILVVTHLRKMDAEYGVDAVAGTTGLTAACDAIWVLRKHGDSFSFELTGREMEGKEYSLRFEPGDGCFGWKLLGDGRAVPMSAERREIVELLREEGGQGPKEIADLLSKNRSSIRSLLRKMADDGDLVKIGKQYQIPAVQSDAGNSGNR